MTSLRNSKIQTFVLKIHFSEQQCQNAEIAGVTWWKNKSLVYYVGLHVYGYIAFLTCQNANLYCLA